MSNYKSVVFDLDGTLMESNSTIFKCTVSTLNDFNIPHELTEEKFNCKIGLHFKDIFEDLNIPVPDIEVFIDKYKTRYFDYIDDSIMYPNTVETLEYLFDKGISISLLTTKAQDQAEKILRHFDLTKYFKVIVGRRKEMNIKPAPDALLYICAKTGILPEATMMVGDSELDIRCGRNAGAGTCAVSFGYRSKQQLEIESPDYIIDDMIELTRLIS